MKEASMGRELHVAVNRGVDKGLNIFTPSVVMRDEIGEILQNVSIGLHDPKEYK